ncbi:MAG TPA: c-type cytochrome [Candidatus Acidoferrum sp.]|nr:c-type cytochrome [Candidatus Acidoferrum sp.]
MKIRRVGVTVTLVLLAASFQMRARGQESNNSLEKQKPKAESIYAEIGKAPEKARAKRNPLGRDAAAVAAGKILFEQRCAECHGDNAEGGKKGPSLRAAEIQDAEPGAIFWILTNGVVRKGMPVWSKLPEPQRWQLVSFIKSLGMAPTKKEAPPARPVSELQTNR